ncbi:hypothetical protein QAD02_023395 [Eretmocerus hayati]|uniref:Uncharacterized protein n=1 Tax=Eretmocerus hayati TaxID=131215 RepID=A0ACC2PXD4_9HYME|nr:hypothetical protein QAD02_023395 [Eretmocerus hayati]
MSLGDSPCYPNDNLVCCPHSPMPNDGLRFIDTPIDKPVQKIIDYPWNIDERKESPIQNPPTRPWYSSNTAEKLFQPSQPTIHSPSNAIDDESKVNDLSRTLTSSSSSTSVQNPVKCGHNQNSYDKIIGGSISRLGSWPWIANLGYIANATVNATQFLCAGSLISSRHVVTAAHCVRQKDNLVIVRLGEYDLSSDDDGANPIDFPIEKKIMHPRYYPKSKENDIAILKLGSEVHFTDDIHPICLPAAGSFKIQEIIGTSPFVAGWGSTRFMGPPSNILHDVQVTVVDTNKCADSYRNVMRNTIDDRVICAGDSSGRSDACQGDSGGPLMIPENSTFYLIGIVSNGYKCAEARYPGVYTRVTSFIDFIEDNMSL